MISSQALVAGDYSSLGREVENERVGGVSRSVARGEAVKEMCKSGH